jgi:N6-adenosine-specific RNA methylase IME4
MKGKLNIREDRRDGRTYYDLYRNNKFVRHIGNTEDLRVFKRDIQLGEQAAEHLRKHPYLAPRSCLNIITEGRRADVGKLRLATDKLYKAIIIDPPWPMEKILRDKMPNQSTFEYPTMEIDEIRALPVRQMTEESGCHVYLWTTQKYLPTAFNILEDWGVEYQCLLTWVKDIGFTPFSFMYTTEHCLFGRYGTLPLLKLGKRLEIQSKRREHSRKPDEFYDLGREVSPEPRLDWFSREPHNGFDQYGNEINKFNGAVV